MAKLKANLEGVDPGTERPCPPDGIYEAMVVEMIDDKPANGKDPRLVIISEIVNADDERYNGYRLWSYFPYDKGTKTWSKESPMAWKVVQMLIALYGTAKVTLDTDNPPEEPFQFKGKVEQYNNQDRLKLDTWLPLDADTDEPEEDDEELEDDDELDAVAEDEDEEEDEANDEDEEEDEEPEPAPAKSRRSTKAKAAAPAAKTRRGAKVAEPEPEEDEEEADEDEATDEAEGDDVPDYPDWTTQELEDEIKVRKLQVTLPKNERAKRKAMIDALNEDDAAAEDPLA
jgi:hypothetical protein